MKFKMMLDAGHGDERRSERIQNVDKREVAEIKGTGRN